MLGATAGCLGVRTGEAVGRLRILASLTILDASRTYRESSFIRWRRQRSMRGLTMRSMETGDLPHSCFGVPMEQRVGRLYSRHLRSIRQVLHLLWTLRCLLHS